MTHASVFVPSTPIYSFGQGRDKEPTVVNTHAPAHVALLAAEAEFHTLCAYYSLAISINSAACRVRTFFLEEGVLSGQGDGKSTNVVLFGLQGCPGQSVASHSKKGKIFKLSEGKVDNNYS